MKPSSNPLRYCLHAIQRGKCNITTLLIFVVFFQIYLLFQNYHASQFLQLNYFQELADKKDVPRKEHTKPIRAMCKPQNHRLFPHCVDKFKFLSVAHNQNCFKNVHGVSASSCSIMKYLREIEPYCLNPRRKTRRVGRSYKISIREDVEGLLKIISRKDFHWVHSRVHHIWPDVVESARVLKKDKRFLVGPRKKLLFFLGSMGYQPNILKFAGKGGFVGELIQWTDLITTSYVLGHDITVAVDKSELSSLLIAEKNKCASKFNPRKYEFDIIFTDINGNAIIQIHSAANHARLRCKLRILDSFGTEAEFNNPYYDQIIPGGKSPWGGTNLLLPQLLTYFPHSPDNTFLGFIAGNIEKGIVFKKENIAVIYGKLDFYLPQFQGYLDTIKDYFEIHATMKKVSQKNLIPSYVVNHGVLSEVELKKLLRKAKLFIGLGFPFEGPGSLDAIANGAVVLNPLFAPPKNKLNDDFFKDKPTLRELTSQNPYMEDFIGKPHVYTVDIHNIKQLNDVLKEISSTEDFQPFLPREFTSIGMLERVHAIIQYQDFCDSDAPRWPPLVNLEMSLAPQGVSCKAVCRSKGRICEPSFFSDINNVGNFQRLGLQCEKRNLESKLQHPSYDPATRTCHIQQDFQYFSCVAKTTKLHRICPCRNFMKGQTALCVGCL